MVEAFVLRTPAVKRVLTLPPLRFHAPDFSVECCIDIPAKIGKYDNSYQYTVVVLYVRLFFFGAYDMSPLISFSLALTLLQSVS